MKLSLTAKRMFLVICICAVIFIFAGAIFYRSLELLVFAAGVLAMSLLNCAKVVMLERAIGRAVAMEDPASAKNHIRGRYFLRLALTIALLLGAGLVANAGYPSMLWGMVAGIFTFQIAAFSLHFFLKSDEAKNPAPPPGESGSAQSIDPPES